MVLSSFEDAYVPSGSPIEYIRQPAQQRLIEEFYDCEQAEACSQILPNLYLGDQTSAGHFAVFEDTVEKRQEALAKLREKNITHIVCVSHEGDASKIFCSDGIKYLSKLLDDRGAELEESEAAFEAILRLAVPFIDEAHAAGGSALVHCAAGAHRSASIVCGYMMIKQKEKLGVVYPHVFHKRPCAFPVYWKHLVKVIEPEALAK